MFRRLIEIPRICLGAALALVLAAGAVLPQLDRDTTPDAFVDPGNPAREYREAVKDIFGLKEPIAVAVVNDGPQGIYTPSTLALVDGLTDAIKRTPNVNSERVTSLATEPLIEGSAAGVDIEDALVPLPETPEAAQELRARLDGQDRLQGRLIARDGSAALILAELIDADAAEETYERIRALADDAPKGPGETVLIAGEAALTAGLANLLDREARRLIPLAGLTMVVVLFLLFRHAAGVLLPCAIAAGSILSALALKAATGTPFYVTGNAMLVVVLAISVADAVHILTDFDARRRSDPAADRRSLAVDVLRARWWPITLTTITTVAGFGGLWLAAGTPPARSFALFTGLGIVAAWVFTFLLLPPALRGLPDWAFRRCPLPGASLLARPGQAAAVPSRRGAAWIVALAAAAIVAGGVGASRVVVDETNMNNFPATAPVVQADREINARFDGSYHMDIVVEAEAPDGLLRPEALRHIRSLQTYAEGQPHIGGSSSIVDALMEINRAVEDGDAAAYRIPESADHVAQLLLLYEMSAGAQGLRDSIDSQRQRALVRLQFDSDRYRYIAPSVEAVSGYVDTNFPADGVQASVTGRIAVSYHWMRAIADNHVLGVVVALALVAATAFAAFGKLRTAGLTLLPVAVSVMAVYGLMGVLGMTLAVGTSMFAALAIGLGIDFAIHSVSALKRNANQSGTAMIDPTTRRALTWNYLTLVLGFAVLMTSQVPTLARFGGLVAVALTVAFLASLVLLPALVRLAGPDSVSGRPAPRQVAGAAVLLALAPALMLLPGGPAAAKDAPSGLEIMEMVNERDEGETVERTLLMELIDSGGSVREREARVYRRNTDTQRQLLLFIDQPSNIAGTGFLTHDHTESAQEDDQWLYLPAVRRVRRISASDRGDYFLGTDFTFEEIKKAQKVEMDDFTFEATGTATVEGHETHVVQGEPVSETVARELGYSKVVWYVDLEILMPRKTEYYDLAGNHLKTSWTEDIENLDGIWTAGRVRAENHTTGHATVLTFPETRYGVDLPDRAFQQQTLRRGRF